jgi:hypothetical protein
VIVIFFFEEATTTVSPKGLALLHQQTMFLYQDKPFAVFSLN